MIDHTNQLINMINRVEVLETLQKNWGGFFRQYQMALNELRSDFQIIDLDWRTRHGYSPIEHIKGRIKEPLSMLKKMERKNIPFTQEAVQEQIQDIAGLRIVTTFLDDVYMMKEHIERRDDIRVLEVKDYIEHPKPSGYKSLHMVVQTKVILSSGNLWVPAEIQLRTSSMDFWAATEHKLNYKYEGGDVPEDARKQLVDLAKSSFQMDQQMSLLRRQLLTL
ncbi:GTP pyrophosphokinase family protein [Paenibacillus profundus]|uniref:GTP pyrophosphokinase family protein n=1 Tax=Paenibacillus profundus TaxID=1173085 RepID=A0ABS8YLL9_9BACL|nr:GTP pyrophosphokinase family protein [Paenibacillus profundus]MCE5171187.1 GTP pyrophosphokinase family protein [Paenibacillus profundus]